MERDAFARAWRYLNYHPLGKLLALASGIGAGLLYVVLVGLVGLFADLLINRGRIPGWRELAPDEQINVLTDWRNLSPDEMRSSLALLGLDDKAAPGLFVTTQPVDQLAPAEQALAYRATLASVLATRIGPNAGTIPIPSLRELPPDAQRGILERWAALPDKERTDILQRYQIPEQQRPPLLGEPFALPTRDRELVWHLLTAERLRQANSEALATWFWQDRQPLSVGSLSELADRGLLRLVVNGRDRFYGRLAAWIAHWNPWTWRGGNTLYLSGLLVTTLLVILARSLLILLGIWMAGHAVIEAATRLRRAVYHHTYRLGTLAFRSLGPSEAVSVFTRHIEAVQVGMMDRLTVLFREPVKLVLLIGLAFLVNVWLALAFLAFAILILLLGGWIRTTFRRRSRVATQRAAEQLVLIQESLMLMRLVKVYLMELFNQARVERQLARYARVQLRSYTGDAIVHTLLVFLGVTAGGVLLYAAGLVVLSGQRGLAGVLTLAATLGSMGPPLVNWLNHRRSQTRAAASAVVLFRFLDRPGEVGQAVGAEFLPPMAQRLEYDSVSLREPGTGRMLLQEVSLTIQAGERVALVGSDELEKHALVYLLPRFLDPTAGEIRIDNHNLRWVTLDSLRAQMALVLQHNLLFNDTVVNNIGCGDPGYTLPKVIEAAKIAHAHQFIQKLPRGYETLIGDMGHPLNAGERFRIALARAILRDPSLLIIEEPTESVDVDTKALIDDTFARVLPGRTVIFLPHRLSTLKNSNRVFFLHKGKLEGVGSHRELLGQNDVYRHLHYLEFNDLSEQL